MTEESAMESQFVKNLLPSIAFTDSYLEHLNIMKHGTYVFFIIYSYNIIFEQAKARGDCSARFYITLLGQHCGSLTLYIVHISS